MRPDISYIPTFNSLRKMWYFLRYSFYTVNSFTSILSNLQFIFVESFGYAGKPRGAGKIKMTSHDSSYFFGSPMTSINLFCALILTQNLHFDNRN
jgi:hypothetical protein